MTRSIPIAAALLLGLVLAPAAEANDIFMIKTTGKAPDAVVASIKAYAQENKWVYLGDNRVKQGQVTLVKVCIPEVGRIIWPVGLKLSALLPCGNLGIYEQDGMTEISALHPRYMSILYPDPAVEHASEVAAPLLADMLEAVAK